MAAQSRTQSAIQVYTWLCLLLATHQMATALPIRSCAALACQVATHTSLQRGSSEEHRLINQI
jgi:hypothetical protein